MTDPSPLKQQSCFYNVSLLFSVIEEIVNPIGINDKSLSNYKQMMRLAEH